MNPRRLFVIIIFLTLVSLIIDLPKNYNPILKNIFLHLGLDLQGGTHLVLQTDMKDINPKDRDSALDSAKSVVERRVNLYGLTEPVVQSSKVGSDYRIIVELPGIKDRDKAIAEIGQTAKLEFRQWLGTESANFLITNSKETGITGKDLKKASVEFDQNTGNPFVSIEFTIEGGRKFSDLTKKLVGRQIPIFIDNLLLSDPVVQEPITNGTARITGQFTVDEANKLTRQLNAGALPVPISILEERTIGATLGAESINKSVRAGILGLFLVATFMALYYGYLGILADLALIIYGLLTLAIFKLLPVTLTLPGIAGFILSIGMAVDSNILIFERMKEEKRSGKDWKISMELGFARAWNSIRDANVTTLITCFILFNPLNFSFLPSFGLVRGFALTLGIGVLMSLFTGIIVTRTLLREFAKN